MTPKEIEDIRSWRRGEWVADVTEIESMVYGLVDELDRLRAESAEVARVHQEMVAVAAESLGSVKAEFDRLRAAAEAVWRELNSRVRTFDTLPSVRVSESRTSGYRDGMAESVRVGRELGLWAEE